MEPIVWTRDGGWQIEIATVDGVRIDSSMSHGRVSVCAIGLGIGVEVRGVPEADRDIAARAVVAAVKVLRGKPDHESTT